MIESLIDKQDNFEIIRDKIAEILVTEVIEQKQLAQDAGKDTSLWDLRVYTERFSTWPEQADDSPPIVNVWYDNSNFDGAASDTVERQKAEGTFNIDCYGFGVSRATDDGHESGDREAAFEAQRAVRLVRNILMAGHYTYLGLRGLVWSRWPQSVTAFQPQMEVNNAQQVAGIRLVLRVQFNEFSPQVQGSPLELVSVLVKRKRDGEIVLNADYDYTGE